MEKGDSSARQGTLQDSSVEDWADVASVEASRILKPMKEANSRSQKIPRGLIFP